MIITVKKPDDCPLRQNISHRHWCPVKKQEEKEGFFCDDSAEFPKDCPLRARTVIIQKEQTETVPNQKDQPVSADAEKDTDVGVVGENYCCQIDCGKDAEWEIYADGVADTTACTGHVGELLTDANEHRIFRIKK